MTISRRIEITAVRRTVRIVDHRLHPDSDTTEVELDGGEATLVTPDSTEGRELLRETIRILRSFVDKTTP